MTPRTGLKSWKLAFVVLATWGIAACGGEDRGLPRGSLTYYQVDEYPLALAIGSDDTVWVACREGQSVVEMASSGEVRDTHDLSAKPMALALDGSGQVWIPLSSGDLLRLDPATGDSTSVALTLSPTAIAIDSQGNLWVGGYDTLEKLGPDGGVLATVHFDGTLHSMAIGPQDEVWLLLSSQTEDEILEVSSDGTILETLPNPTRAWDLAFDREGHLLLYDVHGPELAQLDADGEISVELGLGSANGAGSMPRGVAVASDGTIWTVDSATVQASSADLSSSIESFANGEAANGISMVPRAIAIDSHGNVWLAIANDAEADQAVEENTRVGRLAGVAQGPEFFPVTGPVWP